MPPTLVEITGLPAADRFKNDVGHRFSPRGNDHCPRHRESLAGRHGIQHFHPLAKAEHVDPRLVARLVIAVANHDAAQRASGQLFGPPQCFDEDIRSLQVAHHADVEKIDRIGSVNDRFELVLAQTIVNQTPGCAGRTDLLLVGAALVIRDEHQAVGPALEQPLDGKVGLTTQGFLVVVQAPAVRGIKTGNARP
jgi:hypothetical protein